MNHHFLRCLAPVALLLASGFSIAAESSFQRGVQVDFAALTTAEWIQGEGPKAFEPGKLYLFECWATWCCGCVANIPHVNELHRKFHDKGLLVYGMDVWEDDKERVVKFVRTKGEGMSYPVAYTGRKSPFDQNWLQAAGQKSIPHAFLVKDGKLVLSCDPRRLTDEVVSALLDPARLESTVEKIERDVGPGERLANASFDFRRALERRDFAKMDEAIAECERIKPGDPQIVDMKLDRRFAGKDWQGMLQLIKGMSHDAARDRQLRRLAERMVNFPADAFASEFKEAFLPIFAESLKAPVVAAEANHYVCLSLLQWRVGEGEDANASATQAVVIAREDGDSAAAFEKFAAALKSGNPPKMSELRQWIRESR